MHPQQPSYGNGPALPPPGPEQYDFIMNHGGPNSNKRFVDNPTSKTRLLIAIVAGTLLLMLVWAFFTFLSKATSIDTTPLLALAQRQTELARISQMPTTQAHNQATQNLAATTQMTMLSEQQTFVTYLKNHNNNPNTGTLNAKHNTQNDAALKTAKDNGTYDETYISITQKQLNDYEKLIKQTYAQAKAQSEKQLLNSAYNKAQLLLQQSSQTQ